MKKLMMVMIAVCVAVAAQGAGDCAAAARTLRLRSDGRAGCAWILPDRVNDLPSRFRDPLANDQDLALVFYETFLWKNRSWNLLCGFSPSFSAKR